MKKPIFGGEDFALKKSLVGGCLVSPEKKTNVFKRRSDYTLLDKGFRIGRSRCILAMTMKRMLQEEAQVTFKDLVHDSNNVRFSRNGSLLAEKQMKDWLFEKNIKLLIRQIIRHRKIQQPTCVTNNANEDLGKLDRLEDLIPKTAKVRNKIHILQNGDAIP